MSTPRLGVAQTRTGSVWHIVADLGIARALCGVVTWGGTSHAMASVAAALDRTGCTRCAGRAR